MTESPERTDYAERVLAAARRLLSEVAASWDPPVSIDVVRLDGTYPDTWLVVEFHEVAQPMQKYGWKSRIWDWERTGLDWAVRRNPGHLADMLVTNLQEIVDSDLWNDFAAAPRGETIWVASRSG